MMSGRDCTHFAQPEESVKSERRPLECSGDRSSAWISPVCASVRLPSAPRSGAGAAGRPRAWARPRSGAEMAIALMARNHVPVQVSRDVAEARKVDLSGSKERAQHRLRSRTAFMSRVRSGGSDRHLL